MTLIQFYKINIKYLMFLCLNFASKYISFYFCWFFFKSQRIKDHIRKTHTASLTDSKVCLKSATSSKKLLIWLVPSENSTVSEDLEFFLVSEVTDMLVNFCFKTIIFLKLALNVSRSINATFQFGAQQFITIQKLLTMQDDHFNEDSMFQSLLHRIEMDLNFNDFIKEPQVVYIEPNSPKEHSLKSPPGTPKQWILNQQESQQPGLQKMIDFLSLEQNEELHRIQSSRMDQQSKVKNFLSCHRIRIHEDSDNSRQKHLKDNLNLSPRKKKRIDKQKIKLPKFKLF